MSRIFLRTRSMSVQIASPVDSADTTRSRNALRRRFASSPSPSSSSSSLVSRCSSCNRPPDSMTQSRCRASAVSADTSTSPDRTVRTHNTITPPRGHASRTAIRRVHAGKLQQRANVCRHTRRCDCEHKSITSRAHSHTLTINSAQQRHAQQIQRAQSHRAQSAIIVRCVFTTPRTTRTQLCVREFVATRRQRRHAPLCAHTLVEWCEIVRRRRRHSRATRVRHRRTRRRCRRRRTRAARQYAERRCQRADHVAQMHVRQCRANEQYN
jgi:hypothetical protein